jgi:hypothetical protein
MPIFEEVFELHVAQAADGGVADVGPEGTARIGVFVKEGDGIADDHFIPDADAHGGPLLRIDREAAEVLLVEPEIDPLAVAEEMDEKSLGTEHGWKEVKPGLTDHADDFAKHGVNEAFPFLDDDVDTEEPEYPLEDGPTDEEAEKGEERGGQEGHFFISRMMWRALP